MPVTIKQNGDTLPPPKETPQEVLQHRLPNGRYFSTDHAEVFGRLKLTNTQIGAYFGVSGNTIHNVMRHAALRDAYQSGRTQTIIALRQKQIAVALAGDVTMLKHAGELFGDTAELTQPEPAREGAGRFSWDSAIAQQAEDLKQRLLAEAAEKAASDVQ